MHPLALCTPSTTRTQGSFTHVKKAMPAKFLKGHVKVEECGLVLNQSVNVSLDLCKVYFTNSYVNGRE